jgi:hypothetical protein
MDFPAPGAPKLNKARSSCPSTREDQAVKTGAFKNHVPVPLDLFAFTSMCLRSGCKDDSDESSSSLSFSKVVLDQFEIIRN